MKTPFVEKAISAFHYILIADAEPVIKCLIPGKCGIQQETGPENIVNV